MLQVAWYAENQELLSKNDSLVREQQDLISQLEHRLATHEGVGVGCWMGTQQEPILYVFPCKRQGFLHVFLQAPGPCVCFPSSARALRVFSCTRQGLVATLQLAMLEGLWVRDSGHSTSCVQCQCAPTDFAVMELHALSCSKGSELLHFCAHMSV